MERSRIRAVQMDSLGVLLGIMRMNWYGMQKLESWAERRRGWMKVFSDSSTILKEWGMIGLLKGCL